MFGSISALYQLKLYTIILCLQLGLNVVQILDEMALQPLFCCKYWKDVTIKYDAVYRSLNTVVAALLHIALNDL